MRPVLPIHLLDANQTEVRLVHEGRGLQTVPGTLSRHTPLRNPVQLPFDERGQS